MIHKLNKEINEALNDPHFAGRLAALGAEPFVNSPGEFRKFVREFADKWDAIIRASSIKLD